MIKKILCTILCIALCFALVSCGENTPERSGKTIIDHNGNEIVLPEKIERIAVCEIYPLPSVLSVFFDSAEKIAGMAEPSMTAAKASLLSELYPEITTAETGYMNGTEVNVEELMTVNPDIVFYSAEIPSIGEKLTNAGLTAVAVSAAKWDYDAVTTLNNWISLLSEIFPENDKADKVKKYSEEVLSEIEKRTSNLSDEEKAKVFFLFMYNDSTVSTSGDKFFGDWWAETIGSINVAKELKGENAQKVNMEQIYNWNPDTILITNFNTASPSDIKNNTVGNYDWSEIDAVKRNRVFKMPLGMYRSYTPGVDTPITLWWMAKTVYPDIFSDIDITEKTKSYYKNIFGVDLTDAQADSIFNPSDSAGSGF